MTRDGNRDRLATCIADADVKKETDVVLVGKRDHVLDSAEMVDEGYFKVDIQARRVGVIEQ